MVDAVKLGNETADRYTVAAVRTGMRISRRTDVEYSPEGDPGTFLVETSSKRCNPGIFFSSFSDGLIRRSSSYNFSKFGSVCSISPS
jgi:hypothetical protein